MGFKLLRHARGSASAASSFVGMDPASLRVSCVVQFISTVNKGKKGALDGIGRGGGLAAGGGGGSYEDYAGGGSGRRVDYQRGRA